MKKNNKVNILFFIVLILFVYNLSICKNNKDISKNIYDLKDEIQTIKKQSNAPTDESGFLGNNTIPEEVLKERLESDFYGLNINKREGDVLMVIDSYQVIARDIKDNSASFTVKYKCAAGGYKFDAEGKPIGVKSCLSYFNEAADLYAKANISINEARDEETVVFDLNKINGVWIIVAPALPPHISIEVFLSHTKLLLGDSKDISIFEDYFTKKESN